MSWKSIADLFVGTGRAEVALIGAPMEAGSVTPGRCDLAPETIRRTLRRFSTYDVETGALLSRKDAYLPVNMMFNHKAAEAELEHWRQVVEERRQGLA